MYDNLTFLKKFSHEALYDIWQKAKANDLESLTSEEKKIAQVMLDHADKYFNQFEFADLTYDYQYKDNEENPFMHIILHTIVENQLEARDPIEVYQFYNAMKNKKVSHHEAIHLISMITGLLIFDVIKNKRAFNMDLYKSLLKKHKSRKPDKISSFLDKELAFIFL